MLQMDPSQPPKDTIDSKTIMFNSQWKASTPVKCPWSLADTWLWNLRRQLHLCYCLSCAVWCLFCGLEAALEVLTVFSLSVNQVGLSERRCGGVMVAGWICCHEKKTELKTEQTNSRSPWCLHLSFTFSFLRTLQSKDRDRFGCSSCDPPQWMMSGDTNISTMKLSFISFFMLWIFR